MAGRSEREKVARETGTAGRRRTVAGNVGVMRDGGVKRAVICAREAIELIFEAFREIRRAIKRGLEHWCDTQRGSRSCAEHARMLPRRGARGLSSSDTRIGHKLLGLPPGLALLSLLTYPGPYRRCGAAVGARSSR